MRISGLMVTAGVAALLALTGCASKVDQRVALLESCAELNRAIAVAEMTNNELSADPKGARARFAEAANIASGNGSAVPSLAAALESLSAATPDNPTNMTTLERASFEVALEEVEAAIAELNEVCS